MVAINREEGLSTAIPLRQLKGVDMDCVPVVVANLDVGDGVVVADKTTAFLELAPGRQLNIILANARLGRQERIPFRGKAPESLGTLPQGLTAWVAVGDREEDLVFAVWIGNCLLEAHSHFEALEGLLTPVYEFENSPEPADFSDLSAA